MKNFTKMFLMIVSLMLLSNFMWAQPQGEDCANPIPVSPDILTSSYTGAWHTTGYADDYNNTCMGGYDNGPDVIYTFTLASVADVTITLEPNGTRYTGVALYDQCPTGSLGCIDHDRNTTAALRTVNGIGLAAGTYFVIVDNWTGGGTSGIPSYTITIAAAVPTLATIPTPADQEIDIPIGAVALGWTQGVNVLEMQVLFGTEYPPRDILVDWTSTLVTSALTPAVDWNLQYFWQINYRNGYGTTTGDVWGFTTLIKPPGHLTATAFDGDAGGVDNDVRLEWESSVVVPPPANRALTGYNIWQNGIQIATEVAGDSYVVLNAPYNMTAPGNNYWVVAVFSEGVSAQSNTAYALVNGLGTFNGVSYEGPATTTIVGDAAVHISGLDPDGTTWIYDLTTDATTGAYTIDVIAGTYTITGGKFQYYNDEYTAVVVGEGATVIQDLYLDPWSPPACATDPNPFDTEQDVNANNTTLEWTFDPYITVEYRLLFDTEYPPTDVEVAWTDVLVEEYDLPDLEPNIQYFWQVQVRNMWGEVTNCNIWGFTTTITVPEDLTATVYDINDVLLEWESSESNRAFNHYVVYRDGSQIATTTEIFYNDMNLAYNPTTCYTYNVEAIFDEGDSDWSDDAEACITGLGDVEGYVYALQTSDPIEGATVYLDGNGELGVPYTYTFTTDVYGYYEGDVMAGNYAYTVSADGYLPATLIDAVAFDATTKNDFYLDEEPYPIDTVIATELNDDEVHLEWSFDASRDLEDYSVYRGLWNAAFGNMTYVGNTTQSQFIDYDWGVQTSGVYKWAVVVNYTNNSSEPTYSNLLDKDMETLVNIEVELNTAESPEGAMIKFVNTSEPYLELEYTHTFDASGLATIDPFRKGIYDIEVGLFGYQTIYQVDVAISAETDLSYLLYEIISVPENLYVNPNGFATWDMPTPGGLEMFVADFEGGIPDAITLVNNGSNNSGDWRSTTIGYITGNGAYSHWSAPGGYTDTRMNTPEIALEDGTVVQFAWAIGHYTPTDLFIEISMNEGLTWTPIWSVHDQSYSTYTWYQTTIDLTALGYDSGDAMFSAYKTDAYGGRIWFDEWYIGPPLPLGPKATVGTIAISTQGVVEEGIPKENIDMRDVMKGVEMLPNNLLASTVAQDGDRSLQSFKVWLDDILSGEPTEEEWDYEANEVLVEGQVYHAEVAAVFTTDISDKAEYWFTYHSCAYFDGPASVTADVVIGTMNVLVSWTPVAGNVSGDDVTGVNVFRDGVLITMVPVGTNFYVDEQLGAADYEYCITNYYVSQAQSCQVCDEVTVTPGGYVNGYVKEFAPGNAPIAGAQVLMVATGNPYTFTTDANGYYEGEVVAGTYDYVASATGYASEMLADVFIDFGTTVSQDFELKEFPYPVGGVIATEIDDNSVLVDWRGGSVVGGVDFDFEDGDMPAGMMLDDPTADWGVSNGFMRSNTAGANVWRSAYYDEEFTDYVFEVSTQRNTGTLGAAMGVYVRANDFMHLVAGDGSTGLVFCITASGSYWYGTLTNGGIVDWTGWQTSAAINTGLGQANVVTVEASGQTVQFFINSVLTHTTVTSYPSGYCGVFIHEAAATAEVAWDYFKVVPNGKAMDYAVAEEIGLEKKGSFAECIQSYDSPGKLAKGVTILSPASPEAMRAIVGFNVYRGPCYGGEEDMVFRGFTLDSTFTDNTWGAADWGIYKWAVEAVYDYSNTSAYVYSNCLDKDMETLVTVEVTTNSGDSPEGTEVVFTNVGEPTDPPIVFDVVLDASGIHSWTDFRKGTYDIYVHLDGFADINVSGEVIVDTSYFEFMLEELLAPAVGLYVTPTGFATWFPGGTFLPYFEDFNDGLPDDWTIIAGGSSADTWFNTDLHNGGSLDGTPFMFVNSDAAGAGSTMDELLISPVIENTKNLDALFVEWDQNYQNYGGVDHIAVEVFDGDDWVEVFSQSADDAQWPTLVHNSVDVTEYANDAFQVRFHYFAPNWAWYWGIDNFAVTEGAKYSDRMLEYYKVWHEYAFITDRDTTFYQYGDNGEVLVPGETYMAEVAALYSTGMSPKMQYEWIYMPCDSFPGPGAMEAANVDNTKDVLVIWTYTALAPGDEFFEGFEAGTLPTDWVIYDEDGDGHNWDNVDFLDAHTGNSCMRSASYINGVGALTPDNWLVTPPIFIGPDSKLSFWVDGQDPNFAAEQYYVKVSTTGNAVADFTTTIHSAISTADWAEVVLDLSLFAGEDIYIAFQHADVTDMFVIKIDDVAVSNTPTKAAYTAPVAPGVSKDMPFRTEGMTPSAIDAKLASYSNNRSNRAIEIIGTNVYRDGAMIAYVALPDTVYLDENLVPDYYDYCVAAVYTADGGAHTWTSCPDALCVLNVAVPEDCDAPQNLTATLNDVTYDTIYLEWNAQTATEFRYDDGVSTGQLGFNGGTTNAVLGAVHRVDAELTELSWFLTDNGGPHATVTLYVMGLDGAGLPDGNNVLFTTEATNVDMQWNTFTLNTPLDVTGGFYLAAAYAGFVGVSTDDGKDAPWVFVNNTHYYAVDYTAGGFATFESINFSVNAMLRASGMAGAVASYAVEPTPASDGPSPEYIELGEAVPAGMPNWTNPIASADRAFEGYNIYRDGNVIEQLWQETTYVDADLAVGKMYCYEITAKYTVCGESEPSNEACAGYVGIPELDASEANLYPNPAREQLTIEANDMTRLHIVNYVGQVVYDSEFDNTYKQVLNTANYQSGVYVARIYTENGIITKRFVINR